MIKQVVTTACFALGSAGALLVGFLATHPRAFTHPVVPAPLELAVRSHIEDAPVVVENVGEATRTEKTTLGASPDVKHQAAREDLSPCSGYRDVGAMFIEPRGATGVHRVRQLCATDASGLGR
jgi:hypothetical protein